MKNSQQKDIVYIIDGEERKGISSMSIEIQKYIKRKIQENEK